VHFYKQIDGAKTAVDRYFTALERGDLATAEALVCDEMGPAEAHRAADSGIVRHRVGNVFVHSQRDFGSDARTRTSAAVTVDLTLADGVRHRDVLDVEYEHERWLVCGVTRSDIRR
jgi:ketosteroid isomerase-like protein